MLSALLDFHAIGLELGVCCALHDEPAAVGWDFCRLEMGKRNFGPYDSQPSPSSATVPLRTQPASTTRARHLSTSLHHIQWQPKIARCVQAADCCPYTSPAPTVASPSPLIAPATTGSLTSLRGGPAGPASGRTGAGGVTQLFHQPKLAWFNGQGALCAGHGWHPSLTIGIQSSPGQPSFQSRPKFGWWLMAAAKRGLMWHSLAQSGEGHACIGLVWSLPVHAF